jgi:integrase
MSGCRPLQPEEVVEVAQSFGGRTAARDRALFLVGLYTGFRITELLSLRWRDCLRHGEVTAAVTVARRAMKNKQRGRTVALHPHAQAALQAWCAVAQPPDGTWYVFRSRKGRNRPLTRQSAWQILLDAYASCGMTGRLGTHSLRKTFAMTVHEQLGRDLHRTQQALGHVNISSTLHYLPVADVEIQQAIVAVTYPFGPLDAPRG